MKRALLIILALQLVACGHEKSKSIDDRKVENDLCSFNEGVVIELSSNGNIKYMACLIDGRAEKVQISKTLFTYVYEVYSPGDTVRCSISNKPKQLPKRTNKVPTLE